MYFYRMFQRKQGDAGSVQSRSGLEDASMREHRLHPGKRVLLVVDRSATFVFYMAMLLKKLEYTVRTATTAEDALKMMNEVPPSLVITDSSLPKMSGIDLLKQVKQDPKLKNIPVIMQTADKDAALKDACKKAGSAGFFCKPADPDALYVAIQALTEATPRRNIRIETSLTVEVGSVPGLDYAARMEDVTTLSEGGLYIKSKNPDPVNTVLPLTVFIGTREVRVTAEVVYSSLKIGGQHKVPGMGMKFVTITPADKAFIHDFIKEQVAKDLSI